MHMRFSIRRRGVLIVAALLALGATGRWGLSRPPDVDRLEWGLYQILWSREYGRHISAEIDKFASKPDYLMFYRDLDRRFPKTAIDAIAKNGATTIVSLEL